MRAPRSWLKEFVPIPETISDQEIADAFVRVGFEVEEVIVQGDGLTGPLVVGQVLSFEIVEGVKKPIRYVELNCGEDSSRFVICGAQNFNIGDLVVVSLPGAVLPGGFAISARETYGKTSNGMICSAKELGLGDDHSGIIVLPAGCALPGEDASSLLEVKDTIFDVAVNPDRGYALSIRGLAREIAAALSLPFTDPTSLVDTNFKDSGTPVSAKIEDGAMVMYLRTIKGFDPAKTSPLWMRRRIEKIGMRSISLAVDITNYVMMELGQPLHAFDAAKIDGGLVIRRAGKDGKFTTLDGQERTLAPDNLVVADNKHPLALAGTMGGLDSEITETTSTITLEAVRFDPISIAKNSRFHKLSTEASRRFERAVDPALAEIASARATRMLMELGGATYVGTSVAGKIHSPEAITLSHGYISNRIGLEIDASIIARTLELVGCTIIGDRITPPTWRPDLKTEADLSEEVARNIGYDKIPSIVPERKTSAELSPKQKRRRVLAQSLVARGYAEVLTFPFVNEDLITRMGFVGARAASYKLANPMSEDAPWLRPHLLPGLLDAARRNYSRGFKNFSLFEMGSIFRKSIELGVGTFPEVGMRPTQAIIEKIFAEVPTQLDFVCGVLVGSTGDETWRNISRRYDWADAITEVEDILRMLNLEWEVERSNLAPWHPGRCAEFKVNGVAIAHAGELHPRVISEFTLPPRSAAWGINLDLLPLSPLVTPKPVGVMPATIQDVALVVSTTQSAGEVESALRDGAGELLESITLFDRYDAIGDSKVSLAFTLVFRAPDRTLTGEEVAGYRESAVAEAAKRCGAILRT